MSVRNVKRVLSRGEETCLSKRRKCEPDDVQWQPRPNHDLKSSIYNRTAPEAPAELFRKDLISAMKLPDSEPLAPNQFWVIADPWKQEWERGVQVPVNPDSLPEPAVTEIQQHSSYTRNDFKLPKQKYVRLTQDSNFNSVEHCLSNAVSRAEAACAYDMDACDAAWLKALNGERARAGAQPLHEEQLERVIEELEVRCWDKIQAIMKSEEGLGIEYDENVICDVCRSPDSEEGNEMVFCDSCNICVHQACYGITAIPSGQWLCSPCADSVRPVCVLCPNLGGAMKCTPSGHKWAHVSCVLWIPEVSIGCAEKMEPITKISAIPPSRWSLICILCREKTGACIQCSVKTCKTAYHVTCAFKYGLEMRAIIEDENADDGVKLRSYCQRHSVNSKKDKNTGSGSEEDETKRKRRKDMTSEEKTQARAIRLHEIEAEFDRHVSIKDISTHLLDVDQDGIQYMYNYWKLKRKAGHNRPLLPPKTDESDMLIHRQEQADIDKKRMFVQLRQDLERVRNLCYMVSRREKLSRSFIRLREQTFHKQAGILSSGHPLTPAVFGAVLEANHGPSIYDRLYSHVGAADHTDNFENILALIATIGSEDENKKDLNGLVRRNKSTDNIRQGYCNGSVRRIAGSCGWLSSDAESMPEKETNRQSKTRKPIYSTTDEEEAERSAPSTKKKVSPKDKNNDNNGRISNRKKPRQAVSSRSKVKINSSSDDDTKKSSKEDRRSSRSTLRQMERELNLTGSESDELVPIRTTKKYKLSKNIYSDSDGSDTFKNEDINEDKSSNATSDSQQHPVRTKAAVKEFIPIPKGVSKSSSAIKKSKVFGSDDDIRDKEAYKTKDYPSDLIVPQRKAAKKASENMRSTTVNVKNKEQSDIVIETKPIQLIEDVKLKSKQKFKDKRKDVKDVKDVSPRDPSKKDYKMFSLGNDIFEFEKDTEKDNQDILAYVPQRQAAKKAAEHIKSGLSKVPETPTEEFIKKKEFSVETPKKSPQKDEDKKPKSIKSSSSSSSSSSSIYSSSSSECEKDSKTTPQKTVDKRGVPKSSLSPHRRLTADLPFLDKGSKVSSSSSDSEPAKETPKSSSNKLSPRFIRQKKSSTPPIENLKTSSVTLRKASDKKLKTSDGLPESGPHASSFEREKSSRTGNPVSRSSTRTRTRSITSGPGGVSDRKDSGTRKFDKEDPVYYKDSKENRESGKLSSSQWKTDKKLKHSKQPDSNLYQKKSETRTSDGDSKKECSKNLTKNEKYLSKSEKPTIDNSNREKNVKKSDYFGDVIDVLSESKSTHQRKSNERKKNEFDSKSNYNTENSSRKVFSNEDINYKSSKTLRNIVKSPKAPLESECKVNETCEGQTMKFSNMKDKSKQKLTIDTNESVPLNESLSVECNEVQDINTSKANKSPFLPPAYNRSLFSPHASKDAGGSDVFDFCNDMLAVDETVNDDGFNISQGSEIMKTTPLTFFSSDYLFKEDSKEDRGVPETLHLVEKLRMKLVSKKSGAGNQDDASEQENCEVRENEKAMPTLIETDSYKKSENSLDSKESNKCDIVIEKDENKTIDNQNVSCDSVCEVALKTESNKSHFEEDRKRYHSKEDIVDKSSSVQSPNHRNYFVEHDKSNEFNPDNSRNENIINNSSSLRNEIPSHEMIPENAYLTPEEKRYESQLNTNVSESSHPGELHPIPYKGLNDSAKEFRETIHKLDSERMIQQPECTPIPSPYNSIQQQAKWAESELIPARRSSTSSATSETSSTSHKHEDIDHSKPNENIQSHSSMLQNMGYSSMPTFHSCIESTYNQFSSEASQFVNAPVPLFPPVTANLSLAVSGSEIPISAPGSSLFSPNMSMPYQNHTSLLSQMPKLAEVPIPYSAPCSATFTSSSHNIALTTAMVDPLTPKSINDHDSNNESNQEMNTSTSFNLHAPSLTSIDDYLTTTLTQPRPELAEKSISSNVSPLQDKKSPSKPSRTSSRFTPHQIKSPCKSPAKSPKQIEPKGTLNRRGAPRNARGGRGRGRPRGKTSQSTHSFSHMDMSYYGIDNTIHTKLIGTVYDLDFNDDIANNSMGDLKSMRERRRSTDIHERKSDSYRDSSQSPKFTSPHSSKRSFIPDIKELRPPTPISNIPTPIETSTSPAVHAAPVEGVRPFTNIVQPVLPGPVDRYSAFEPSTTDAFNNHLLGAFDSETADQQLADIDEEVEKALHSALIASSNKTQETPKAVSPKIINEPSDRIIEEPPHDMCTPKVSLTDPRNQLKVKIKGPFLNANYSSYIPPVIQQPSLPTITQPQGIQVMGTPSAVGSVNTSGPLRMRKKELLRQYCNQDMNMDDPSSGNPISEVIQPAPVTSFSRNIITIPKAVASMTSIPTREDYKAVVDANMEKKRRKVSGGLSREMRHFEMYGEGSSQDNQSTTTNLTATAQIALSYKRRGRLPKPAAPASSAMTAPKLKIKIGNYVAGEPSINPDPKCDFQFRPPKKRLASIPKPSVEDLRRESMKYRKMVMADFEGGEKEKKKRGKSEKRKKKREKRSSEMHIVDKKVENSTKLIIRIRKKDEETTNNQPTESPAEYKPPAASSSTTAAAPASSAQDPFEYDPSAPDPLALDMPSTSETGKGRSSKVSPIRLKLSRGAGGSGYVMKDSPGTSTEDGGNVPLVETSNADTLNCPITHNKHCEVR